VKNGLGMESFLDKLVQGAENPALKVIDSSRGIATLENTEKPAGEDDHGHDHGDHESGQEPAPHDHDDHGQNNYGHDGAPAETPISDAAPSELVAEVQPAFVADAPAVEDAPAAVTESESEAYSVRLLA
jgi:zinc/manganese transport system substrate-binding protein